MDNDVDYDDDVDGGGENEDNCCVLSDSVTYCLRF